MTSRVRKPDACTDIFLQPGEFYFGNHESRIRTVLGSCVAITMWHPRLRIGGMCHYMLPMHHGDPRQSQLDGRYAEDAISLFLQELNKTGSWPADYEVKMFGGGNQFPDQIKAPISVPDKNIRVGRRLLTQHGFSIKAEHLGGNGHRNVVFDLWSGQVWLRHFDESSTF